MATHSEIPLPRTCDDLPYVFIWRLDDFIPPIACLCIGILLGFPFAGLIAGFLMTFHYQRYRDGRPELWPLHWLYWAGVYPGRGPSWRNPYLRTYEP